MRSGCTYYVNRVLLVSHKLLPPMIIETREKEGSCRRQLDIRQWNLRNSRTFGILTGGYACVHTRRIPCDKSSADGTFDRTGNCICNIRKLQTPFTGESKKKKKSEAARREPRTTCRDYVQLPTVAIAASNNRRYPLLRRVHLANALDVWRCHDPWNTKDGEHVSPQPHTLASLFRFRIHDVFLRCQATEKLPEW